MGGVKEALGVLVAVVVAAVAALEGLYLLQITRRSF